MTAAAHRVLLLFLDGVGVGAEDPDINPFLRARIPTLLELMGGKVPTLERPSNGGSHGGAFPLSATLDVAGLPQSGTGQVALLTGESAAELHGRHFGPWTPVRLRPLVERRSLLRRAVDAGRRVAFANAYPRWWPGPRGSRRIAGPPLAAQGAGILTRHEEALGSGDAVSSEIVNDAWRDRLGYAWLPVITAQQAGANLARIASEHDLTLYAHYSTDTAGHGGTMEQAIEALERVDAFVEGVVNGLGPEVLLLIASDHGNLEDVTVGHTTNPALGVATGPCAGLASEMRDLRSVCPFILGLMGIES